MRVPSGYGAFAAPPAKKRGCLSVLLWVSGVGCALFFCCCVGSLIILGAVADENSPTPLSRITEPLVTGEEIALGEVVVPADAVAAREQDYHWPYDWKRYQVQYGIDEGVRSAVDDDLQALAKRLKYQAGTGGQFHWSPPAECSHEGWQCVYQQSAQDNRAYVSGLAEVFRAWQRQQGLGAREVVELVVSWVQHITYQLPNDEPFGLLPAARVASEGWGDCDSKTLLAALVLDELGIETVLLHSQAFKHAALGVAVPAHGDSWTWRGDRYFYVEVTAPGWAIGTLPPDVDTPRAWQVIAWKR